MTEASNFANHTHQARRLNSPSNTIGQGACLGPQFSSSGGAIASVLLDRLENVRQYGKGLRAACPAHGGQSTSSLSIAQADDGRLLIHCFGGCEPLEILKVCGLEISDLMPERITHNATPAERRKWREAATIRDWEKARSAIQHEARVVWVAGKQIKDGKPLNDVDDKRLDEALEQITIQGRKLNAR